MHVVRREEDVGLEEDSCHEEWRTEDASSSSCILFGFFLLLHWTVCYLHYRHYVRLQETSSHDPIPENQREGKIYPSLPPTRSYVCRFDFPNMFE